MPDDHSELVPLLPIPNRTVKRLSADDSADSRVKVGHRQAFIAKMNPRLNSQSGVFSLSRQNLTLPLKNVSLAEWFNSDKENANDEDIKGALHARI